MLSQAPLLPSPHKAYHVLPGVLVGRLGHLVPPRTCLFDVTFDPRSGKPVWCVQYFTG